MAIVINGSGTLSGLAVGGLPDGTVDAGTLATNSVDSAELIDGAVDDSHMAAMAASKLTGTVATERLPADNIIYVAMTDFGSGQFQSATASATVDSTTVITVPSVPAGGKILAIFSGGYGEQSSGYGNNWGFIINGTYYKNLTEGRQSHLNGSTMQKTVTFASAVTSVVVSITSTKHSAESYQEFRLGGASPAMLTVFVIK